MKALLEIYLQTAGVTLARQHFLTRHECQVRYFEAVV